MCCYAIAMLYYAMLYYVILCHVMLCYVMLCYVVLCCAVLCCAVLSYVMLCYVLLCCVKLSYVILCYVMLCYVCFCCSLFSIFNFKETVLISTIPVMGYVFSVSPLLWTAWLRYAVRPPWLGDTLPYNSGELTLSPCVRCKFIHDR